MVKYIMFTGEEFDDEKSYKAKLKELLNTPVFKFESKYLEKYLKEFAPELKFIDRLYFTFRSYPEHEVYVNFEYRLKYYTPVREESIKLESTLKVSSNILLKRLNAVLSDNFKYMVKRIKTQINENLEKW